MFKDIIESKDFLYKICFGLILFLGIFFRLNCYIQNPSLWHDECALAWNIFNKSYSELFGNLRFLQIAPPFFMILTKFLTDIFRAKTNPYLADYILRFIPFISSLLSIYIAFLISKKLYTYKKTVLFAVTLFSINPILIAYSTEFKQYSTDTLFTLISILIFLSINFEKDSAKKIWAYGLVLATNIWFSFVSGIVILAGFLTMSFKKENPKMFSTLLFPVLISGFIYLNFYILNTYTQNIDGMLNYWNGAFIAKDFSNISNLINMNMNFFFTNNAFVHLLVIIAIIMSIIFFIKENRLRFLTLANLTFGVLIITSVLKFYPFAHRLIIFSYPIILLLIAKSIDFKGTRTKNIIMYIALTIFMLPLAISSLNLVVNGNPNKLEPAREFIKNLSSNIKENETIIVNESSNAEYFYYIGFYNLNNKMIYHKNNSKKNTINNFLNDLEKGTYWFYMPYDYSANNNDITAFTNWIENNMVVDYSLQKNSTTKNKLIKAVK